MNNTNISNEIRSCIRDYIKEHLKLNISGPSSSLYGHGGGYIDVTISLMKDEVLDEPEQIISSDSFCIEK